MKALMKSRTMIALLVFAVAIVTAVGIAVAMRGNAASTSNGNVFGPVT